MTLTQKLAVSATSAAILALLTVAASAAPCKNSGVHAVHQSSRAVHPAVIHERAVAQTVHHVKLAETPKDIVDTAV